MNKLLLEDWLRRDKEDLSLFEDQLKVETSETRRRLLQISIDAKKKTIEICESKLEELKGGKN